MVDDLRAIELQLARHLSEALNAYVRDGRSLTNQDVTAGAAEFFTQVCVRAFAAERDQGYPHAVAEVAEEIDALTGAVARETMRRLARRFTPEA
jgi:hypothetical protein